MEEFLKNNTAVQLLSKKPKVLIINTGGTFASELSNSGESWFWTKNYLFIALKSGSYPSLNVNLVEEDSFLENDFVKVNRNYIIHYFYSEFRCKSSAY